MKKTTSKRSVGFKKGFRSGLEEKVAAQLKEAGISVCYEQHKLTYEKPAKVHTYTPDFILPNGIVIETKGWFVSADRQKHLLIRDQHKDLDLRFVFSNPNNRISKLSKTTYGMWCSRYGFLFAAKTIPTEWLNAPTDEVAYRAAQWVLKWKEEPE